MLPVYSTVHSQPTHRFRHWRDAINDTFFPISCDSDHANAGFFGTITQLPVGIGGLFAIDSQAVHYERRAQDIERGDSDCCQIFLVLEGRAHISQHDRQATVNPGQLCMYTTGEPFRLDIPAGYRSLMLTIPRAALASRLPKLERFTARTLGGVSGISRLVGQLMRDAGELDNSVGEFALMRLGTPIADMVALGLEAELCGGSQAPSRAVQLLGRIKSRMQESIEDCDLDINQLAHNLGLGVRTMNRLFAAEGTTAMHWLQQQRLQASYRLLVEGRADRVADAALSCGFSNLSHFSRVFKREFGVQPRSLLRKAV